MFESCGVYNLSNKIEFNIARFFNKLLGFRAIVDLRFIVHCCLSRPGNPAPPPPRIVTSRKWLGQHARTQIEKRERPREEGGREEEEEKEID